MTERRASYDAAAWCAWCGDMRQNHDRLAREWETCQKKVAFFAHQAVAS